MINEVGGVVDFQQFAHVRARVDGKQRLSDCFRFNRVFAQCIITCAQRTAQHIHPIACDNILTSFPRHLTCPALDAAHVQEDERL
jgi:hypothetical protein